MCARAVKAVLFAFSLLSLVPVAQATCGGGGGGGVGGMMRGGSPPPPGEEEQVYIVPWNILDPGTPGATGPLILYWLPATRDEIKGSQLRTSRELTMDSGQCIGMEVVLPEDTQTIEKLGSTGKLPAAVLVDVDGKVIQRVDAVKGSLRVSNVEKMLRDELSTRSHSVSDQLKDAQKKASAGDKSGAVDLYTKVWEQRCLFPSPARKAQKALEGLGVTVKDAALRTIDPDMSAAMTRRMSVLLADGLRAEVAGKYPEARAKYLEASRTDRGDPVALRYLGELYRHQTGEWDKAASTFNQILSMNADPLSRAVALHGLGKMKIHEGDYQTGLTLFERSIATFPLALTYRNLAVYWNSERDHEKAYGYVKKALALDPEDPFNLVFAATYLADAGRSDEALQIAKANEGLLAASYNLAAIYAVLGNKGKAMELLHRHFETYERYDAVRAKEKMEARVDYVFVSLRNDPEFVKMTEGAD